MKRVIQTFILASILLCSCSKSNRLSGEWKPDGEKEKGSLIFNKDGTFVGIDEDGKTDDMGFKSKNIKYKTDF